MRKFHFSLLLAVGAALSLAACGGEHAPGDATGAKVMRNLLESAGGVGRLASFKKIQAREMKNDKVDAFELMYEAEIQFPNGYDAKCANEKDRGICAYLGLDADQTFAKGELLKSEGTLHFVKSDKGWVGEDNKAY